MPVVTPRPSPSPARRRTARVRPAAAAAVAILLALGAASGARNALRPSEPGIAPATPAATGPAHSAARSTAAGSPTAPVPAGENRHPVRIRQPIAVPRVETALRDGQGRTVTVSCASCHATSAPRTETRSGAELDEFHQGLSYAHGNLTCLSCHDASNYDRLRLADGRGVEFPEALDLCAQCHGPQMRDYRHGSHGGMTGYWDLRRGPRERNHCVDCHDPHAPAYPVVLPAFPPAPDRGLHRNSPPSSHE